MSFIDTILTFVVLFFRTIFCLGPRADADEEARIGMVADESFCCRGGRIEHPQIVQTPFIIIEECPSERGQKVNNRKPLQAYLKVYPGQKERIEVFRPSQNPGEMKNAPVVSKEQTAQQAVASEIQRTITRLESGGESQSAPISYFEANTIENKEEVVLGAKALLFDIVRTLERVEAKEKKSESVPVPPMEEKILENVEKELPSSTLADIATEIIESAQQEASSETEGAFAAMSASISMFDLSALFKDEATPLESVSPHAAGLPLQDILNTEENASLVAAATASTSKAGGAAAADSESAPKLQGRVSRARSGSFILRDGVMHGTPLRAADPAHHVAHFTPAAIPVWQPPRPNKLTVPAWDYQIRMAEDAQIMAAARAAAENN
ncbi:hypothetical protein PUNSTDRAFT_40947 [Punctularia strigosozonata HHB-11173 SS5]|uniref:uncharacterized protein n=1 Tax=Punctularia strigosozonata (strain HHB-11173) TaxID=741275 RepID=UPI00044165D8|nr:uncharacterized protein PUNSTDRAFT_40947 [Punctularia strigosozonata HHB-11173 SS5]EIN13318.1 hypothetical protein PUNSTDRAFT_40947 [Punctularia strigosozonata HHB-11173 SS5]